MCGSRAGDVWSRRRKFPIGFDQGCGFAGGFGCVWDAVLAADGTQGLQPTNGRSPQVARCARSASRRRLSRISLAMRAFSRPTMANNDIVRIPSGLHPLSEASRPQITSQNQQELRDPLIDPGQRHLRSARYFVPSKPPDTKTLP